MSFGTGNFAWNEFDRTRDIIKNWELEEINVGRVFICFSGQIYLSMLLSESDKNESI